MRKLIWQDRCSSISLESDGMIEIIYHGGRSAYGDALISCALAAMLLWDVVNGLEVLNILWRIMLLALFAASILSWRQNRRRPERRVIDLRKASWAVKLRPAPNVEDDDDYVVCFVGSPSGQPETIAAAWISGHHEAEKLASNSKS